MTKNQGIDTSNIALDSSGRYELNAEQLAAVAGGAKKGDIEVIRGSKCKKEGPDKGKVIRGTKCTDK